MKDEAHNLMLLLFTCCVGDWYSGPAAELDTEPDEEWVKSRRDESRAFQEWDEDADIDESGELCLELKLLHSVLIINVTFNKDVTKEMSTHFSILAWKIPWTEKPGGL